jgi:hypothetical protein
MAQSVECVFLGYSPEHKGYHCYDPSTHRMRISRDVTFVEDHPFFYSPSTQSPSSSTESTYFLYLPPILSSDDVPYSTPSPSHDPPPILTHHSTNPIEPPSNPSSSASPDAPVLVDSNASDESQVRPRYNLCDRTTIVPLIN